MNVKLSTYLLFSVLACLAACDQSNPSQTATSAARSSDLIATATKAVTDSLKDPESARFDKLTEVKNSKDQAGVCGYVNAKNSMGGYEGFQKFAFNGKDVGIVSEEDLQLLELGLGFAEDRIAVNTYPDDVRVYHLTGCEGPLKEERARVFDDIYRECLSSSGGGACLRTRWDEKKADFKARFADK